MKKYILLAFVGVFAIFGAYLLGKKEDGLGSVDVKESVKDASFLEDNELQSNSLYGKKSRAGYINVDSDVLFSAMKSKDFVLINVHIPYEGEISQTDQFIPYNKIVKNKDLLPKDKSTKIVLYCLGGGMSARAAKDLKLLGYNNVYNLKGGMISWKKRGYEIVVKN